MTDPLCDSCGHPIVGEQKRVLKTGLFAHMDRTYCDVAEAAAKRARIRAVNDIQWRAREFFLALGIRT